MATVVALIGPLFAQLAPLLLSNVGPLTALLELLPPLAELIMALMPAINLVVGAMVIWGTTSAAVMTVIATVVAATIGAVVELLTFLVDTISGAVVAAIEGLSDAWKATTEDISEFYNRNIAPLVGKLAEWAGSIKAIWDRLWQAAKDVYNEFFGSFAADVKSVIDKVVGFFSNFEENVGTISENISGAIDSIVGFFTALPGRIASGVSGVFDAITDPFQRAWDEVSKLVGKITGAVAKIPGGGAVGSAIGAVFGSFAKGGLLDRPTIALAGEAGREAIIPLDKPLNQIDPSVRAMAAMLRGQGQGRGQRGGDYGARSITNNSFVLNEVGNADATAQRVLNRLAVAI